MGQWNSCRALQPDPLDLLIMRCTSALLRGEYGNGLKTGIRLPTAQWTRPEGPPCREARAYRDGMRSYNLYTPEAMGGL